MAESKSQDNSILTMLLSLVIIILYYMFLKPVLKVEIMDNVENFAKFQKQKYIMMIVLFMLLFLIHMAVNLMGFHNKCGGSLSNNLGKVFISTFVPWLLIFGALMLVLIIFPGFKGAFSNVIGYYAVYRASNTIFVKLLGNAQVDRPLENVEGSESEKANILEKASDAVLKLVGNTSIMINQITPENFEDMWNMMIPVMKPEMRGVANAPLKAELLEQVVLRDNIGECCWYLYTMLLLLVIVKTMLMKQECVTMLSDLKEKEGEYDKQQREKDEQENKDKSVVYKG
jgi:ABC-type multidrug transport system fused ATPase/permease subunit